MPGLHALHKHSTVFSSRTCPSPSHLHSASQLKYSAVCFCHQAPGYNQHSIIMPSLLICSCVRCTSTSHCFCHLGLEPPPPSNCCSNHCSLCQLKAPSAAANSCSSHCLLLLRMLLALLLVLLVLLDLCRARPVCSARRWSTCITWCIRHWRQSSTRGQRRNRQQQEPAGQQIRYG